MHFHLSQFLQIADQIAGPILAASGVPPALVPVIVHGIRTAEVASAARPVPLSGLEKKALVLDGVATALTGINAVKPGAIDPNVTAVAGEAIDTVIGTVNAIHKKPIDPTL